MNKDRILRILREHAPELHAAGITRLRLFGSVARDQAGPNSDIDLLADLDPSKQVTLVTLGRLEYRLGTLLGAKVELSTTGWISEPVRQHVMREAIVAF